MSNFTNRKRLCEEEMEALISISEFSDDSSQSYDSDMSSQNINRPISSKMKKMTALTMNRQTIVTVSLLIDSALLVYLCLSSGELFYFIGKSLPFLFVSLCCKRGR